MDDSDQPPDSRSESPVHGDEPQRDSLGSEIDDWISSGCAWLTGVPGVPLGPPLEFGSSCLVIAEELSRSSADVGQRVSVDVFGELCARAAIAELSGRGSTSCGGATRLHAADDRWIAISLARDEDRDLVSALVGRVVSPDDPWSAVARCVAELGVDTVAERARLLGLPFGVLPTGSGWPVGPECCRSWLRDLVSTSSIGAGGGSRAVASEIVVVELGSLWAAPLCGALLARAGCDVVKIESTQRPDGARLGPAEFFDRLNFAKQSVAVDFGTPDGREILAALIRRADVVIEGSRPRALEWLGISPTEVCRASETVWLSITAHGYGGPGRDRVGFGDDAAVAGGLVAWNAGSPSFCLDAVADPLTGLVGAICVLEALRREGAHHIDLAMVDVAERFAAPTVPLPSSAVAIRPSRPRPSPQAPALGADTTAVVRRLLGGRSVR